MKNLQERAPWEEEHAQLIDELCEYAECSGFSNFYEKKVKGLSEEEFMKLYSEVMGTSGSKPFVREENLEELRKNYVPVAEISIVGCRYISPEHFEYRTTIYLELQNGTAVEWQIDEPFDITKGDFTKVKSTEDLLHVIYDMDVVKYVGEDPLLLMDNLPEFNQIATISVQVDEDYCDEPGEDDIVLEKEYGEGFVGYDFIHNKPLEKAPHKQNSVERMICELVANAEALGDSNYFDRVLKYKTDEEIIELYFSTM